MITTVLAIAAICATVAAVAGGKVKFKIIGMDGGKHIVEVKDGPVLRLSDAELEEFKTTGKPPEPPAVAPTNPAGFNDRITALELKNAELEARVKAIEEDDGVDPKEKREAALAAMSEAKLKAAAAKAKVELPEGDFDKDKTIAAILAKEFPEN